MSPITDLLRDFAQVSTAGDCFNRLSRAASSGSEAAPRRRSFLAMRPMASAPQQRQSLVNRPTVWPLAAEMKCHEPPAKSPSGGSSLLFLQWDCFNFSRAMLLSRKILGTTKKNIPSRSRTWVHGFKERYLIRSPNGIIVF
jgi:hypothetical protein